MGHTAKLVFAPRKCNQIVVVAVRDGTPMADIGLLALAEMFHALPEQPAYADNCG